MPAKGDLVLSSKKVNFTRDGKGYAEYVVGTYTGHGSRVLCNADNGYVEIAGDNLVTITDAYKVTLSALGIGVVDAYFAGADKEEVTKKVIDLLAGKTYDVAGRSVKSLPWSKPMPDKEARPKIIALSIVHMKEARR